MQKSKRSEQIICFRKKNSTHGQILPRLQPPSVSQVPSHWAVGGGLLPKMIKNRSRLHGSEDPHSHSDNAGTPASWVMAFLNVRKKRKEQANGVRAAQQEEGQDFVAGAYLDHRTHKEESLFVGRCDDRN